MKRRLALVWILALVSAGCDGDPTEPELESPDPTDHSSAGVLQVGENQFAVDFSAYEADQRLWESDWTRIARRWPMDNEPMLGDWRAQEGGPSFTGRMAALLEPPLDRLHLIALQWDALPILEPPLEILTRLWLAPVEKRPRVGIAWFIQPDETGLLKGFALDRNLPGHSTGVWMTRLFDNPRATRTLVGGTREREVPFHGGWIWIRLRHTTGSVKGTIQYRAWQGSLANEPSEWDAELISESYGPHGGWYTSFDRGFPVRHRAEPMISGGAGLYVGGSEDMNGVVPLWGAFTVGINGAPAPPPPGASKASLVLECEPERPIRGTEVTCTASTEPQGAELEVSAWRFTSEDGDSIPAPEGQGAIWEGDMVVSGTVTVEAIVDGEDQEESVQVKVDPRDWDDGIPPPGPAQEIVCPASGVPECPLRYPPTERPDLGATLPIPPKIRITATQIGRGPNWGYSYITDPVINFVGFATYLNPILFDERSRFWRDSGCQRSEVLSGIRDHEAAHVNFFFAAVNPGVTNLNRPFEKLVYFEPLEAFRVRARELGRNVQVTVILPMMANESVTPPDDPRLSALPSVDCDFAFSPSH